MESARRFNVIKNDITNNGGLEVQSNIVLEDATLEDAMTLCGNFQHDIKNCYHQIISRPNLIEKGCEREPTRYIRLVRTIDGKWIFNKRSYFTKDDVAGKPKYLRIEPKLIIFSESDAKFIAEHIYSNTGSSIKSPAHKSYQTSKTALTAILKSFANDFNQE